MTEVPWGIRKEDGRLVGVDQVEQGLACGCICPGCKAALVAAKGEVLSHHFRHYAETPHCDGAPETALHLLAKQIVVEARDICLPDCRDPVLILSAEVEPRMDGIRPDVLLRLAGQTVAVEILVAHPVPADKVRKLAEIGQAAMEIDVGYYRGVTLSVDEMTRVVLYDARRQWLRPDPARRTPAPRHVNPPPPSLPLHLPFANDLCSPAQAAEWAAYDAELKEWQAAIRYGDFWRKTGGTK
jgi:hypothetical protein